MFRRSRRSFGFRYMLSMALCCSQDASARAERVSARVRRLDTAQQRSEQLLMMIRAVRTRENVVDGVRTALAVGNLPAAVENVR